MRLRTVWKATALGLAAAMVIAPSAVAQRPSAAESGLVGIKLFDSGLRLLAVYGQPDDIQPLGGGAAAPAAAGFQGGGAATPTGAAGGGVRGGGGGGGGRAGGGRGAGGGEVGDSRDPFGFGNDVFFQGGGQGQPPSGYPGGRGNPAGIPAGAGMPPGFVPPGAAGGQGGPPSFGPGIPPAAGGGGAAAPAGPSYSGSSQGYTRWIYKRSGAKYGFIMDGKSRIVQIEAIGIDDKKVRTRKGLTFGASFVQVIKTYGWPDSYEVAGNSITMRYLLKNKVVFRLNRLGLDKPHVVTGVLIAAAKS